MEELTDKHIKQLKSNLKEARLAYKPFVEAKDFDSKEAVEARRGVSKAYDSYRKALEI